MLAGRVTQPTLKRVDIWQEFQQAGVSLKWLGDILNAPTESATKVSKSNLPAFKGSVAFRNVKFRYTADARLILNGLNLELKSGQSIGIVGRSGSGENLTTIDTVWLRQNIGVVLQESSSCQIAGAHEFILELIDGYDTVIEEGCSNFSGGQKQRLYIARASRRY
eukprot:12414882-Karenia_brevis.AAC.1